MIEAVVCYIRRAGRTLLVEKLPGEGVMGVGRFNGLGGKLEPGETPKEAVIREVWEEAGLRIRKPKLRGTIFVTPTGDNLGQDVVVYVFTTGLVSGKIRASKEGLPRWIDNTEVPRLKRWKSDEIFWPLLNKRVRFTLRMIYEGDEYKTHELIKGPLYKRGKQK